MAAQLDTSKSMSSLSKIMIGVVILVASGAPIMYLRRSLVESATSQDGLTTIVRCLLASGGFGSLFVLYRRLSIQAVISSLLLGAGTLMLTVPALIESTFSGTNGPRLGWALFLTGVIGSLGDWIGRIAVQPVGTVVLVASGTVLVGMQRFLFGLATSDDGLTSIGRLLIASGGIGSLFMLCRRLSTQAVISSLLLGAGTLMMAAPALIESIFSRSSLLSIGSTLFTFGLIGSIYDVIIGLRAKPSLKPGGFESRKTFFGYFNPGDWGFSMYRVMNWIRYPGAYAEYALYHKKTAPSQKELETHLPEAGEIHLNQLKNGPPRGIQVLWIGHASVLVQIDGVNILFDPVFHDCGPCLCGYLVSGYRRFRGPAVTVDDLKRRYCVYIHAVCISHNHYDHLDVRSVRELVAAYGDEIHWFVPKGMEQWFRNRGCQKVADRDWWDSWSGQLGGVSGSPFKLTFTPAKHYSLRDIPTYYCRHLWGAWFVNGPHSKFFFSGDTGYVEELFEVVRKECGSPDVTAIPIGAYKPRRVMEAQHIDPLEALKIHIELGATHSIGIHWGTFAMSNEKINEPVEDLKDAIEQITDSSEYTPDQKANLRNFVVLKHGEVRFFSPANPGKAD